MLLVMKLDTYSRRSSIRPSKIFVKHSSERFEHRLGVHTSSDTYSTVPVSSGTTVTCQYSGTRWNKKRFGQMVFGTPTIPLLACSCAQQRNFSTQWVRHVLLSDRRRCVSLGFSHQIHPANARKSKVTWCKDCKILLPLFLS